jgi:hypothetical protein
MALVVKDRVKVTTATTGTGTLTLGSAVAGFQAFSAVLSNADTTYYAIFESSTGAFEVGLGTYASPANTLARTTILESSNAGSAINLTAGNAEVFITYPAEKAVYLDAAGDVTSAAGQINVSDFNNDAGYTTNTGTVTSVAASAGTGISISGSPITTSGTLTITNTAPDQTVVLTQGANITITGTYPNFTIASSDQFTGTVTSVGGTGTVNGLSLSGTVTTSGNLTLGGTLSISNADWSGTDLSVANGGTGASSFTANNVLLGNGTSSFQTVAPGTSGNVLTSNGTTWTSATPAPGSGTLDAVASGALSNGDIVVINADGTVSVVAGSGPTVGTPVVFESATTEASSTAFDSNTNTVVVAYRDDGNSSYGTAVVGTVSGTAITFGTPVVFRSASLVSDPPYITFDSSNDKFVIAYEGSASVGTVSGTSISFGSAGSLGGSGTKKAEGITFDSSNNKVVVFFRLFEDEVFDSWASVGTVSGTSISFGTRVRYSVYAPDYVSATFDTNTNKVVFVYRSTISSVPIGFARVGTVSETSISYGTEVRVRSVDEPESISNLAVGFDEASKKVVVACGNGQNPETGFALVGTVTGTSLLFGQPVNFAFRISDRPAIVSYKGFIALAYSDSGSSAGNIVLGEVKNESIEFGPPTVFRSGSVQSLSAAVDSNSDKVVIAYRDNSGSNYGTAAVFDLDTNLRPENYIGVSSGDYSDAATATVQLIGSVNEAQSGLTVGARHFVQTDGTLATQPDFPTVYAGLAVASTKLIVKG